VQTFPMGVKWLGHEADHSLSSGAEVKIEWSYISAPPVHRYGMMLSSVQGKLYLYLTFYSFIASLCGSMCACEF
jgi:hypothetical protein